MAQNTFASTRGNWGSPRTEYCNARRREIWAQPACNPTGNFEFTFGGGLHPPSGNRPRPPNLLGNTYAYIPVSISLNDDRLIIHTNQGKLKGLASGRNTLQRAYAKSSHKTNPTPL